MDKLLFERCCALTLNRIFGYEPQISTTLINTLGSAAAVFELSPRKRLQVFGQFSKHAELICQEELDKSFAEYEWLQKMGYRFLAITEADYPVLLKESQDPPAGLYIRSGSPLGEIFGNRPCISIVGTRDMSPYGKEFCERIVCTLSKSPSHPTIVSGLAFGIDVTAHAAALACGLPTIAVSPTSIEQVYPSSHSVIAGKIAKAPSSAVISDYAPNTASFKVNFLRRNRIIAALSKATIVVESKENGGAMITASLATDYGRDVFALPGRIDDLRSKGCNNIIKCNIATPIVSMEGLDEQLGLEHFCMKKAKDIISYVRICFAGSQDLPLLEKVCQHIRKERGAVPEDICREQGMSYSEVSRCLGLLVNQGIVNMDVLQRCTLSVKND